MESKITIEIQFTKSEADALKALATAKDMSIDKTILQALRLYHYVTHRQSAGDTMLWQSPDGQIDFLNGGCGCAATD